MLPRMAPGANSADSRFARGSRVVQNSRWTRRASGATVYPRIANNAIPPTDASGTRAAHTNAVRALRSRATAIPAQSKVTDIVITTTEPLHGASYVFIGLFARKARQCCGKCY